MTGKDSTRNCAIDLAKFIAAVAVIAIHTHPLKDVWEVADFFLVDIVCRMAVPFFAVCTGYYATARLRFTGGRLCGSEPNRRLFAKSIRKIIKMYLFWSVLYLGLLVWLWNDAGVDISYHYFTGWLFSLIFGASYYHLWYLISIAYAFVWFYLVLRYVRFKYIPVIITVLWAAEVAVYLYREVLPESIHSLLVYYDLFNSISVSITRMLPLLLTGAMIAGMGEKVKKAGIYAGICFLLLVAEAFILRQNGWTAVSFAVFTLPLSFFFFISISRLGSILHFQSYILADISMMVYCIHPVFIWLMDMLLPSQSSHLALFVLAVVCSVAAGLSIHYWKTASNRYSCNGMSKQTAKRDLSGR